uniref:Right handed beta helix domain-containing protein n=1 Tax=Amphimedon queenslandica TaxID=400682 RepID=A0A1X7UMJ5_AMPQE
MQTMLLLSFLFSCFLTASSSGCDYYVSDDPSCESCHNLRYYVAANISLNNTLLCFKPGLHQLQEPITIANVTGLTIKGIGSSPQLVCSSEAFTVFILFYSCDNIVISNIEIKNCSSYNGSLVSFSHVTNLTINNFSFFTNGSALLLENTFNVTISGSTFQVTSLESSSINYTAHDTSLNFIRTNATAFIISNTTFLINSTRNNTIAIGLQMKLDQSQYFVDVILHSLSMVSDDHTYNIYINASTTKYNILIDSLYSHGGIGGIILTQNGCILQSTVSIAGQMTIINSFVTASSPKAIAIVWDSFSDGVIHINSTVLYSNFGQLGSAIYIGQQKSFNQFVLNISLTNVTIRENKIVMGRSLSQNRLEFKETFQSAVALIFVSSIKFTDCWFIGNQGSGLFIFNSLVTFRGANHFVGNSGHSGGGVAMYGNSFLLLKHDSMLNFTNNHANQAGGAVFISQIVLEIFNSSYYNDLILGYCFFQLQDSYVQRSQYFFFKNNTARVGSIIYGGTTSHCNVYCNVSNQINGDNDFNIYDVSTIENQPGNSLITSDARDVCFCFNDIPQCDDTVSYASVFPGNPLNISVVVTGGVNDNATTGIVELNSAAHVLAKAECTTILQTVDTSSYTTLELVLSVSNSETNFDAAPKYLFVTIEQCPLGYHLSNKTQKCECDFDWRNDASVTCNELNGTFTRSGLTWIGMTDNNCTVISQFCEYCKFPTINLYLNDSDEQCGLNRTGIYCGECAQGLGLMLGSNRCKNCSNGYIALTAVFALAGVVLVIFIILMNLTVTVGVINGFLFFANVVKMYQPLFIGLNDIPVLSQFISWVNLDLGIETCFFAGMNACVKSGLQFIFPFYVWFLILIIIFLSRKFSRLSRLIGNNAVPVLCTLILLSYTKLLRNIVDIFSYSRVCSHIVWYNNPRVQYCTGCHLPLFITALSMIIILFVPYTLFLLFFPLWELCRSKWSFGTTFYLKLKPFFDAYAGPHKDYFRIWPGLLVLVRIVLAIAFAISEGPSIPAFTMMIVTSILILILSFRSVYKNSKLHNLDICYLLCLIGLVFVLDDDYSNNIQLQVEEAVIGEAVILSLSFIGFLGILAYHVYNLQWIRDCFQKARKSRMLVLKNPIVNDDDIEPESVTTTVVKTDYSELREPLLDTDSH